MEKNFYKLPSLPYGYDGLEPHISAEQLKIHYEKHHFGYVKGANAILEKFDKAREKKEELDIRAELKALSFNVGGHYLHSLFWENLTSDKEKTVPNRSLFKAIAEEFGGLERFKQEFALAAAGVEGSGWAALSFCGETKRLIIMQIEKHNVNAIPTFGAILILDVFEHAYYLDYKNERTKFVEAFWNIANWEKANERYEKIIGMI